ncbi:RHS repeat-associated core domain-containing protein, partial [Algivirga pacifica]|uniref:RHS repeat-associated core domain-containing protein n=1 Tax=Algivirga pacifica TaxID=1162670 RepID=UPI0031EFF6D7
GFNGKENDKDFGNAQLIQDYGFRLYNPGIGRFLSVDPLTKEYPWYTPYQFAGNKVIMAVDLDGLEEDIVIYDLYNSTGQLDVDMIRVAKGKTHATGVTTNGRKWSYPIGVNLPAEAPSSNMLYWQEIVRRQLAGEIPEMLSKGNLITIQNGASPRVDNTWIKYNKQHATYMNDVLTHHHKDRLSIATAIPTKAHREYNILLHHTQRVKERVRRYTALKKAKGAINIIGGYLGDAMDILHIYTDSPRSPYNSYNPDIGFLNEPIVGRMFYDERSLQYFQIDANYVQDGEYQYIKYSIYEDYKKNEDTGKFEGVNKVGEKEIGRPGQL